MVDISKAIPIAPKYAPVDVKQFTASKEPDKKTKAEKYQWFLTVIKPHRIVRLTGILAARRRHRFDNGGGEEYLIGIFWPLLKTNERKKNNPGMGGFQKWADKFALGTIPVDLLKQVDDKSAEIPSDWDEVDLGALYQITFTERDELQFWDAHCIGMSVEERRAIYAKRESERKREAEEKKRRAKGAKSRVELSADARRKAEERTKDGISATTQWRRANGYGRNGKRRNWTNK